MLAFLLFFLIKQMKYFYGFIVFILFLFYISKEKKKKNRNDTNGKMENKAPKIKIDLLACNQHYRHIIFILTDAKTRGDSNNSRVPTKCITDHCQILVKFPVFKRLCVESALNH
jgi:hypothetical protein